MDFITKSARETKELGQKIGRDLKPGDTLALFGDLGGGKTTFLQGVAQALGIKERVLSPTFIISRDYLTAEGSRFYHFDWYRINNNDQARALGIKELFGSDNIVAIEWAERALKILPKRRIEVYFNYQDKEGERKITILNRL